MRIDDDETMKLTTPYTAWSSLAPTPGGLIAVAASFVSEPTVVVVRAPSQADVAGATADGSVTEIGAINRPTATGLPAATDSRADRPARATARGLLTARGHGLAGY